MQNNWNDGVKALQKAIDFLQLRKMVPVSKFLPFDILLAPITYFFFSNERPSYIQLNEIEKFFWRATASKRYAEGQNSKIENDIEIMETIIDNGFAPDYDYVFTKTPVRDQELSFSSSFAKTILCLYSTLSPKDIRTNENVALTECFAATNARQIHHLFPRKNLETLSSRENYKSKIKQFVNSITNVCLLTALSNQIVGSKRPNEYLEELSNPYLKTTLESQLITGDIYENLMNDEFESFYLNRSIEITSKLREKIRW